MSDQLVPFHEGGLTRASRQASRAIVRNRSAAQVRMARIDDEADVTAAKVDAVSSVTGTALRSVVGISQLQVQLEMMAPGAAARLAFLADDHALAMSELLADLRRELRRK